MFFSFWVAMHMPLLHTACCPSICWSGFILPRGADRGRSVELRPGGGVCGGYTFRMGVGDLGFVVREWDGSCCTVLCSAHLRCNSGRFREEVLVLCTIDILLPHSSPSQLYLTDKMPTYNEERRQNHIPPHFPTPHHSTPPPKADVFLSKT
jgi:hypothetical protein